MIKAINYGTAIGNEKFIIKLRRDYVSYIKDDYALRISRYMMNSGHYSYTIDFKDMTTWLPPHQDEPLLEKEKLLISQKIESAINKLFDYDHSNTYIISRKGNQLIIESTRRDIDVIKQEFLEEKNNYLKNHLNYWVILLATLNYYNLI